LTNLSFSVIMPYKKNKGDRTMAETKNINFKIDIEVAKAFKALCRKEGFKQGKTVEKLIREMLSEFEDREEKEARGV